MISTITTILFVIAIAGTPAVLVGGFIWLKIGK